MSEKAITAIFTSHAKAEQAINELSSIGLTDIYIRSGQYRPTIGSLVITRIFFGTDEDDIAEALSTDGVTVVGAVPYDRSDEAVRIIEKHQGKPRL